MTIEQLNQRAASLSLELYQLEERRKLIKKELREIFAMHAALDADAKRRAKEESQEKVKKEEAEKAARKAESEELSEDQIDGPVQADS